MNQPLWEQRLSDDLHRLRQFQLYRQRRILRPIDSTHVELDGERLVNFASNNYLGLTHHPRIVQAICGSAQRDGAGSGAGALVTGYGPAHDSAEHAIARWKGTDAAVLLPSGYQANHAAIQAAAAIGKISGGVRFLVDKLAHASLIDAIRSAQAEFRVFPHNHMSKLRRLLGESDENQLQVVVTESIFSMDGDAADLRALAELRREREFLLLLDEAHATGIYGPAGSGLAAELGLGQIVDAEVMTLSKAMGGIGGAVCGSELFCQAVVNYGRAYLYSTAVPSSVAAAAEAAIQILGQEPYRQARVRALARTVREAISQFHPALPPGDSPIIPILLGDEEAAMRAAERLRGVGMLVPAIRPPTVPRGRSRLRVTLSSEHTDDEVQRLIEAIKDCPGLA